jgi:hypothetical protein
MAKYELLEPVTRGSVETFVARRLSTDERVLVHIFECPEQRQDQPTVLWVLESFRAVAPAPPELVLGTGKYSGTSYAYLVTKLPESTVLQAWVRSYQAQEETKGKDALPDSAAVPDFSHSSKEVPPPHVWGTDQSGVVGRFDQPGETRLMLGALPADVKVPTESSDTPSARQTGAAGLADTTINFNGTDFGAVENARLRDPGEFTRQFSGLENLSEDTDLGTPPETPSQKGRPRFVAATDAGPGLVAESGTPDGSGSPSGMPNGASQASAPASASLAETARIAGVNLTAAPQPKESIDPASDKRDDTKSGEFTRFFQGPFHGERPSQTPNLSRAVSPPPKQPGEFTKIFGKNDGVPSQGAFASQSRFGEPPGEEDPGTLAPWFHNAGDRLRTSEAHDPTPQYTEIIDVNTRDFATFVRQPSPGVPIPPRAPVDSPAQPPVPEFWNGKNLPAAETTLTVGPEADGATRVFSARGRDSLDGSATRQDGPSDFTRIISGGLRNPSPSEEESLTPTESHGDFVKKLAAPPAVSPFRSSLPGPSPPPQFQQPGQHPHMPTPPGVPAPPLPPASPLGSAVPKPTGPPWTLIIVLNGLFIIAVLLVLYFALKH